MRCYAVGFGIFAMVCSTDRPSTVVCAELPDKEVIFTIFFSFAALDSLLGRHGANVYMVFDRNQREYCEYLPYFQKVVCVGTLHAGNTHDFILLAQQKWLTDIIFLNKNNLYRPHSRGMANVWCYC